MLQRAQGEVGFAVQSMLQQYDADYVGIETSGEGDPAPRGPGTQRSGPRSSLLMRCEGVVGVTTRPD